MIKKVFRGVLTLLLIGTICVMMLIFVGVGFVGGVVIKSWDSIDHIDLGQLEYREVDTWKQHLEVYSSLCTVQPGDSIDFLLDKLKRLEYPEKAKNSSSQVSLDNIQSGVMNRGNLRDYGFISKVSIFHAKIGNPIRSSFLWLMEKLRRSKMMTVKK